MDIFGMDTLYVNINPLPEVEVRADPIKSNRSSNPFGFILTTLSGGTSPPNITAEEYRFLSVDLLFLVLFNAVPSTRPLKTEDMFFAEFFSKIKDIWGPKTNKEIKEEGTNDETDAFGRRYSKEDQIIEFDSIIYRQVSYPDLDTNYFINSISGFQEKTNPQKTNKDQFINKGGSKWDGYIIY